MTELNPNGGLAKGVLLSSRQLTITLDPTHHAMLTDLTKVSNKSVHATAEELLGQAIIIAHVDLRRQKFVWQLCWWIAWGNA